MTTSASRSLLVCVLSAFGASACGDTEPPTVDIAPSPDAAAVTPDGAAPAVEVRDGGVHTTPGAPDGEVALLNARVSGLTGTGLRLRTMSGEELAVMTDGEVTFAQPLRAAGTQVLEVVQQPTAPSQTCSAAIRGRTVEVVCDVNSFSVGGSVQGLAGPGLVLSSSWGETLAVDASGSFHFAQRVRDLSTYSIEVLRSPDRPRQSCQLTRREGKVNGADVADLTVVCTTAKFSLKGAVHGLLGKGLVVELENGEAIAMSSDGKFAFQAPLPDGSRYNVRIKQQPTSPNQRCLVIDGEAALAGADVELAVVCGALGGLRISEVGSCYYANSACWVEVYNAGQAVEELSYYQLRSTAADRVAPYTVHPAHKFTLPSAAIAPKQRLLVQAQSTGALPDGQGVLHVRDQNTLPWWTGSGFVELVTAGQSVDFVRFGDDRTAPLNISAWNGDAAPTLPSGADGYGHSLARDRNDADSDRASDWAVRAFATPSGVNDVSSDVDSDRDGIPDESEQRGGTFAGLDLYAMGARVGVRDVFVEIDHMASNEPGVLPRREALEKVVSVFASHGVALHFDVGSMYSATPDAASFNLGGGNEVPFAADINFGSNKAEVANFYDYKASHLASVRRSFFYYSLFGWALDRTDQNLAGSSGLGERPGNDTIITLGGWDVNPDTAWGRNLLINYQASTLMHELGHNFGLRHGGGDDFNRKPNYVSVMNYVYSPIGLSTIGRNEGDRYYLYKYAVRQCSRLFLWDLTNPPTGESRDFVLDFSEGESGDLNEANLLERDGLGRSNSGWVDFNCNGKSDTSVAFDLNDDGRKDVLQDHDDWSRLEFVFRRNFSGSENGPSVWWQGAPEPVKIDLLTDDVQDLPSEACPGPSAR